MATTDNQDSNRGDGAFVAANEMAGLLETAHLLRSPANAEHLLKAVDPSCSPQVSMPASLLAVLANIGEQEPSRCEEHSDVFSLSYKVRHRSFVLLVRKSHLTGTLKVVLMEDSFQAKRMERARKILTSRQFEAFIEFENGARSSEELAKALSISKRTAERYHANIVYLQKKQLLA